MPLLVPAVKFHFARIIPASFAVDQGSERHRRSVPWSAGLGSVCLRHRKAQGFREETGNAEPKVVSPESGVVQGGSQGWPACICFLPLTYFSFSSEELMQKKLKWGEEEKFPLNKSSMCLPVIQLSTSPVVQTIHSPSCR